MMTALIIIFGSLTLIAGFVIVIKPESIFGFLRDNLDNPILHVVAVVVRLALGISLINEADVSKFPSVIEILGWLSIFAAAVLALMGRRNFNRLMTWALGLVKPFGRVSGIVAIAFGAFLVYAFV